MPARRPTRKSTRAILLFADSEQNADQRYFSGFDVPDPFIAIGLRGKRIGVFNALEIGRACKDSSLHRVLAFEDLAEEAKRSLAVARAGTAEVITLLARRHAIETFDVPHDFPLGLAVKLQRLGVKVEPADGPILPGREIKSEAEARAIAAGNRCSAIGLAAAEDLLRRATIARGRLSLNGRPLTSERVREAIEVACLRAGAVSQHTIVAGGDQACDPHCVGSGPLRANELIIVDIFPRVNATGFHGDMTRTFLKGTPSDAQAKLVAAVRSAQKHALVRIRAGAIGTEVHAGVVEHFKSLGYETKRGQEGASGFFHGTGHGLGLAVHEAPNMGRVGGELRRGAVVTVEPGLYYPGLGGCRIEDVVQVTDARPRMLSKYHYAWVIA